MRRGRGRGRGKNRSGRGRRRGERTPAWYNETDLQLIDMPDFTEARAKDVQKAMIETLTLAAVSPEDVKEAASTASVAFFQILETWVDAHAVRLSEDAMLCVSSGNMQMRGEKSGLRVEENVRKLFIELFAGKIKPYASSVSKSNDKNKIIRVLKVIFKFLKGAYPDFKEVILKSKVIEGMCQLIESLKIFPASDPVFTELNLSAKRAFSRNGYHKMDSDEKKLAKDIEEIFEKVEEIVKKKEAKRIVTYNFISRLHTDKKSKLAKWCVPALTAILTSEKSIPNITHSLTHYAMVIRKASAADINGIITGTILQTLKKDQKRAIPVLGAFCKHISADLSSCVTDLLPFLIGELTSNEAPRREAAIDCIQSISKCCQDAKAVVSLLTKLGEVLLGKKGNAALSDWQSRLGVINAINSIGKELNPNLTQKQIFDVTTRPILDCLALMKKESQDQVRSTALRTVVDYTIKRKVIPAKVQNRFSKGLGNSAKSLDRNIVGLYVSELNRLNRNSLYLPLEDAKAKTAYRKQLTSLVEDADSNTRKRGQLISSLTALIKDDTKAASDILEKFEAIFRNKNSNVNNIDLARNAPEQDALDHIELGAALLTNAWARLKPQPHEPFVPKLKTEQGETKSKSKPKKSKKRPQPKKEVKSETKTPEEEKIYFSGSLESPIELSPYHDFLKGIVYLSFHGSSVVRRKVSEKLSEVVTVNPEACPCLSYVTLAVFDDVYDFQKRPKEVSQLILMGEDEDENSSESKEGFYSAVKEPLKSMAIRPLVSICGALTAVPLSFKEPLENKDKDRLDAVAIAAFAAHHPIFGEEWRLSKGPLRKLISRWSKNQRKAIEEKAPAAKKFFGSLLSAAEKEISNLVFSNEGLRSSVSQRTLACIEFSSTMLRISPSVVSSSIIPSIVKLLSINDISKLTKYEREVVCASEGEVVDEVKHKRRNPDKQGNMSRNIRSRNKAYSAESERWAREEMQKSAEAKKKILMEKQYEIDRLYQSNLRKRITCELVGPMQAGLMQITSYARKAGLDRTHDVVLEKLSTPALDLSNDGILTRDANLAIFSMASALKCRPTLEDVCMITEYSSKKTLPHSLARAICHVARFYRSANGESREDLWDVPEIDFEDMLNDTDTVTYLDKALAELHKTIYAGPGGDEDENDNKGDMDEDEDDILEDEEDMDMDEKAIEFTQKPLTTASLEFVMPLLQSIVLGALFVENTNHLRQQSEELKLVPEISPSTLEAAVDILCLHCDEDLLAQTKYQVRKIAILLLTILGAYSPTAEKLRKKVRNSLYKLILFLDIPSMALLLGNNSAFHANVHVRLFVHNSFSLLEEKKVKSLQEKGTSAIAVGMHDTDEYVRRAAARAWTSFKLHIPTTYASPSFALVDKLEHKQEVIRNASAAAIAQGLGKHPQTSNATIEMLLKLFDERKDKEVTVKVKPGEYGADETKMEYHYHTRQAVLKFISFCAPSLMAVGIDGASAAKRRGRNLIQMLFQFFISKGFKESVNSVWNATLEAALAIIETYGEDHIDAILPMLEAHLALSSGDKKEGKSKKGKKKKIEEEMDRVREGVVICLGNIARFLPSESQKVRDIISQLIEMLETPSYDVQGAVSNCLVHLIRKVPEEFAGSIVETCLTKLASASFGARKGGAFGLGGLVKGLGLESIQKYAILARLTKMVADKKNNFSREGALFAYERLFASLQHHFEPYLLHVLPHLLKCFGDSSRDVRKATQAASRKIMSSVTNNGMKVVMPLVLRSLNDPKWRTKVESISLLGSMAHLSATQLSRTLPTILPRLLKCLSDPHEEVQKGARKALRAIGGAVQNPEIYECVPTLLSSLARPAHCSSALKKLINISFVHAIDPASLALVAPLLARGLRDRENKNKQMSAQIIGSICSLVADTEDLMPYAQTLIKLIKGIISDNSPLVRKVAAMAMGSLYKGLGSDQMPGIMEELLETLRSDTTAVQRSGAALGVSHLLVVMGPNSVTEMLPTILDGVRNENSVVREGFANLFITLPDAFGQKFVPFVPNVLKAILLMLHDNSVEVRSLALQAGHMIAQLYTAVNQIKSVLPTLTDGLSHPEWRSRMGACHIIGTYLCQLGGSTGQVVVPSVESEELVENTDDGKEGAKLVTSKMHHAMAAKVGYDKRNHILSLIYLMRSDSVHPVANTAFRVWKAVVVNSPATLKSIFPTLITKIIEALASQDAGERQGAGDSLGGIVAKMGVSVLRDIVPLLQKGLTSDDEATRQGVCLGLREVMRSTSKKKIAEYVPDLIAAVRDALCDEAEDVRVAAGEAFQTLHIMVGQDAINQVVPALVNQLSMADKASAGDMKGDTKEEIIDSELVLGGIKQILKTHSRLVLPFLIPQLAKRPLSMFCAQALAALSADLGRSFFRYIQDVILAFIEAIESASVQGNGPRRSEFLGHAAELNAHLAQDGIIALIDTLCEMVNAPTEKSHVHDKLAAVELIGRFCKETKCDISDNIDSLLGAPMSLLTSKDPLTQKYAVTALKFVMADRHLPKSNAAENIPKLQQAIRDVTHAGNGERLFDDLPGFNVRGALRPFIPLLSEGLMKGNEITKMHAAQTMAVLVDFTKPTPLSMYVMLLMGPLIRMANEQFSDKVKLAILRALSLLLLKCGPRVKAFFSALQTTFRKALHHKSQSVRSETIKGLSNMMRHNPHVDNVISGLILQVSKEADVEIKTSMFDALSSVLNEKKVGKKASKTVVQKLINSTAALNDHKDADLRGSAGCALGTVLRYADTHDLQILISDHILDADDVPERHFALSAVRALADGSDEKTELDEKLLTFVSKLTKDENPIISVAAIHAARSILVSESSIEVEQGQTLFKRIADAVKTRTGKTRQAAIQALQAVGYLNSECDSFFGSGSSFASLLVAMEKGSPEVAYDVRVAMYMLFGYKTIGVKAAEKRVAAICKTIAAKSPSIAKSLASLAKKSVAKTTEVEFKGAVEELGLS